MAAMLGPVLRMLVSLAIVLALMYIAARLMRRTHGGAALRVVGGSRPAGVPGLARLAAVKGLRGARPVAGRTAKAGRTDRASRRRPRLEVLARQPLGKATSVAVVRVADRTLLLGVSDSSVQLLTELDAAAFADGLTAVSTPAPPQAAAVNEDAGSVARVSVLDSLRERTVRRASS